MAKFSLVSLPPGPLSVPLWETAFAAEASDDGSTGVIFVATKAGGYVVKASSQPAEQYFANLVLNHIGVPVPSSRVVCHVDAEWSAIKLAIRNGAQRVKERGDTTGADRVRMRLRGPLDRPQLHIMELIPDAKQLEGNANAGTLLDPASDCPLAAGRLRAMGRCLAADVLLNYSDRIPAPCWDNEGNGGNIMLTKANIGFCAIDSGVTTISGATSYSRILRKEYIFRARTFLEAVCAEGVQEPFAFETISTFVFSNTGHKLSDPALNEIRTGFLQVISFIVKGGQDPSGSAFLEWLERQHKVVASGTIAEDWGNVWKKSVAQIDMSFLHEMVAVFCEAGNKYEKIMPDPEPIKPWPLQVQHVGKVSNLSTGEGHDGMSPAVWAALPAEIKSEFVSGDRHCDSRISLENCDQKQAINPKWGRFTGQSFVSTSSKVESDLVDEDHEVPILERSLQSPEPASLPPPLSVQSTGELAKGGKGMTSLQSATTKAPGGKGVPPPLPVKCATPPSLGKGKQSVWTGSAPGHNETHENASAVKGAPPPLPSVKGKGPALTATNAPGGKRCASNGKGPPLPGKGTSTTLPPGKGKGPARTDTNEDALKSEISSCNGSSDKGVPPRLPPKADGKGKGAPPPLPPKEERKGPLQRSNVQSSLTFRAQSDEKLHGNGMPGKFNGDDTSKNTPQKCNCDNISKNAYPPQPTGLAVPAWQTPQSQREVALKNCKKRDIIRIVLLQQAKARDAISGAAVVDASCVDEEKGTVGQPSKVVVLPEGFVTEVLDSGAEHLLKGSGGNTPPELMPYAAVAAKHQVYIVCGTMIEPPNSGAEQWYTTTVVLGPDGRAVGAYRKRRIHDHQVQLAGANPLIFDVPGFGRIGVLICLDAEDDALLEEMVALGVRCVVNPIHIPVPGLGAARGSKGLATGQWRVALDSVARRLEWWSAQHGMFFVRCDLPFPGGSGTSQVIGPDRTETISSMDSDVLKVSLTPVATTQQLFMKVPSSSYVRSLREENCGPRAKVARVCLKREEPVAAMRFVYPQGSPRGKLIVVFEDRSVCTIDVATLSMEANSAATLAQCKERAQETLSAIAVPSAKAPAAWLGDDCRCLLRISSAKQLEVVQCKADGLPTTPLVISATSPADRLALDHLSGGFAVATSSVPHMRPDSSSNETWNLRSSFVSFWGFSHNRIPAPFIDFMKE